MTAVHTLFDQPLRSFCATRDLSLDKIVLRHVERFVAEKLADGRAPKSVRN